jgi:hypothetical protein
MNNITVSGDPEFVVLWYKTGSEMDRQEIDWISQLRAEGIKAAHPDDGWVDRTNNQFQLQYPQFNDGVNEGDLVALGWPSYETCRIVKVTNIGKTMFGCKKYKFEQVRIRYNNAALTRRSPNMTNDELRALLAEAQKVIRSCGQYIPEKEETDRHNRTVLNDLLSRITAALAEKDGYGWMPIETAPKDGTRILVYFKPHGWVSCSWDDADHPLGPESPYAHWHVDDFKHGPYPVRGYINGDDIYWQPLPTLPTERKV